MKQRICCGPRPSRIESVDVIRTIAIVAVIAIHTTPLESPNTPIGSALDLATTINQTARFAVPFFFLLSGYFWADKFVEEKHLLLPTVKMLKRISLIFLAWSAIYLLPINIVDAFDYGALGPPKVVYWNLLNALSRPMTTVLEGTKVHLWFLVSLSMAVTISAAFLRFNLRKPLIAVAAALYVVGLAGKAYADTPIGFHADFNFRNGPFFALAFFVTGYMLRRRGAQVTWFTKGLLLFSVGLAMHFAELFALHELWGVSMAQDYVGGTYFMGLGMALVALSGTKRLRYPVIASIGPLVLGIYVSHLVFVDLLRPLDRTLAGVPTWEIFYVVAVFFLSWQMSRALSRHHLARRLVA